MAEFTIKDSGNRQSFETGAVRDVTEGKIRPDKIPTAFLRELGRYFADHDLPEGCRLDLIPVTLLIRLGTHYGNGAKKYAERNWERGIPVSRCNESLWRHFLDHLDNEKDEDHACAMVFNIGAKVHWEETGNEAMLNA